MAKIEAHQFIARWRRIIIPLVKVTEAQAAFGILVFSAGLAIGMFCYMVAEIDSQRIHPDLLGGFVVGFFILFLFCLFLWIASNTREACRVLGYSFFEGRKH